MTKQNIVVAPLATVTLSDGTVHYLNKGATVPKGTSKEQLKHLLDVGVVEAQEVLEVEDASSTDAGSDGSTSAGGQSEEVELPEGDPTIDWNAAQLKAAAEKRGLKVPSGASKPDVLALITEHDAK